MSLSDLPDVGERDLRLINIYFEFSKIHNSRNLQNDQVTRNSQSPISNNESTRSRLLSRKFRHHHIGCQSHSSRCFAIEQEWEQDNNRNTYGDHCDRVFDS